jgi:hypothetical protein
MTEEDVMRRVAAAFGSADPVPDTVSTAAERAGRSVGVAAGWTSLALVAGGDDMRGDGDLLGFARRGHRIDVQVETTDSVRLMGLASGGAVWVRWPDGERQAVVDDIGRFTVTGLPRGPLCLVLRRTGRPDAVGPWFVG